MIVSLVKCGADINAKSEDGSTALAYLIRRGRGTAHDVDFISQELINHHHADVNTVDQTKSTPLSYALRYGLPINFLIFLIPKCTAETINQVDQIAGRTALHWAAQHVSGDSLVGPLLAAGANPTIIDKREGDTPLTLAKFLIGTSRTQEILKNAEEKWIREHEDQSRFF